MRTRKSLLADQRTTSSADRSSSLIRWKRIPLIRPRDDSLNMSEVAGLTLGTVALASLFQSCVEVFDYFELARNYINDHHTATLKLRLLRERLRAWGSQVHLLDPENDSTDLRQELLTRSDIIEDSLKILRRLLSDSDLLVRKYKISKISQRSLKLRKRTVWAVHDRAKFDRLLQDISFLIEGLEKVVDAQNSAVVNRETSSVSAGMGQPINNGDQAMANGHKSDVNGNTQQPQSGSAGSGASGGQNQPMAAQGIGGNVSTMFTQRNVNSHRTFQGHIGAPPNPDDKRLFDQENQGSSFDHQGGMTEEQWAALNAQLSRDTREIRREIRQEERAERNMRANQNNDGR